MVPSAKVKIVLGMEGGENGTYVNSLVCSSAEELSVFNGGGENGFIIRMHRIQLTFIVSVIGISSLFFTA